MPSNKSNNGYWAPDGSQDVHSHASLIRRSDLSTACFTRPLISLMLIVGFLYRHWKSIREGGVQCSRTNVERTIT